MYKTPRGTQDIMPQEQPYWRFVAEKASSLCQLYGYQRIDTPVFEETELFYRGVGGGTDIVEKEMYTFEDHSGTKMTLRPEGTAPVCRAYIEHGMHNLPQPVKLYYFAPIFRYERPQAGRYRQHHQFGVECLGSGDPAMDVEVIGMAWQFYTAMGLHKLSLQLNSIGCKLCRPEYLQILRQHYSQYSQDLCRNCQARVVRSPLRLLDCKEPSCQQIARKAPQILDHLCPECASHFRVLREYLEYLQIPYHINPQLVRGLDYYTRTVFEVQPKRGGAQSTLGGGGRYDDLIEQLGGKPTPAVGFATGIERVILTMRQQNIAPPSAPSPLVYLAYLGAEAKKETVKLAAVLRQAGVSVNLATGDRSLKAQLKQANVLGINLVIIVGEEETKRGCVILRDMVRGEQKEVGATEIVAVLLNRDEVLDKTK